MSHLFTILEEHHKRHVPEDEVFYNEAINGINPFCGPAVFGSGPHCVKCFREFIGRVGKGKHILEIGFNAGVSAALMLAMGARKITSVELTDTPSVRDCEQRIKQKYGDGALELIISDSAKVNLTGRTFDAAYVDGDHSLEATKRDLGLVLRHGCKLVLMDDWLPQFGTSLQAADEAGWTVDRVIGNFLIVSHE